MKPYTPLEVIKMTASLGFGLVLLVLVSMSVGLFMAWVEGAITF